LLTARNITGCAAAINALERNESEQMELALSVRIVSKKSGDKNGHRSGTDCSKIKRLSDGSPGLDKRQFANLHYHMGNAMVFAEVDGNINSLGA
jgi:hypothetical protein